MPDSVSTETAAFIAGGSGVLGALVGALGGGVADYFLERRSAKTKAKAGARLMRSELTSVAEVFGLAEQRRSFSLLWDTSVPAWERYGDVIATQLNPEQWSAVDDAVRTSRSLTKGREHLDKYGAPDAIEVPLEDDTLAATPELRNKIRLAYNALAHLANGEQADETFGVPPAETQTLPGS